jgi:carbonic anhydrase
MRTLAQAFSVAAVLAPALAAATPESAGAPTKPDVQTRESQAAMTPAAALERLKAGNARFAANAPTTRDWKSKVAATKSGQFPFAAILGCMDSRGPVEIVFDQGIGDVFVVRVAGNVVNDDELGSLEYAVSVGTKLIVVLGHTSCGAVKGAIDEAELGHLTGLLAKIRPAVEAARCSDAKNAACVDGVARKNVEHSIKEIRERSPYLAKHLDEGKLGLVGAMYDLATGEVTFLGRAP